MVFNPDTSSSYLKTFYVFLVIYLVAVCAISFKPRGTDQYWSLANVERVVHGDHQLRTNNIYPASMPDDLAGLPRPWVQNRPVVYLVVAIAFLVRNAQLSWLICNCLFLFATVFLLQKILRRSLVTEQATLLSSALLLLFPLNFYLVMQALPEQINQLLVMALAFTLLAVSNERAKALLAGLLGGLLIYQRDNFILLILLVPLYFILTSKGKSRITQLLIFLTVIAAYYLAKPLLLPSHTIHPISTLSIISEVRPGKHNMVNYLYTDFPHRSASDIAKVVVVKTINALRIQFDPRNSSALFTWSMNLLLLPFILLLIRFRRLDEFRQRFLLVTLMFCLIHISTIIFFENQYRFSAVLIPLLITCLTWWLQDRFNQHALKRFLLISCCVCLIADAAIAYGNRKEAIADSKLVARYQQIKSELVGSNNVMIEWSGGKQLLPAYVFEPAYCYFFPLDASINDLQQQAKRLNTDFYIVNRNGSVYRSLRASISKEEAIDSKKQLVLIQVARNTN